MRVWLDDERQCPDSFNVHVKDADSCIEILKTKKVTHISLDHDLGQGVPTGYDVAKFIEMGAHSGLLPPMSVQVHTQNAVGRKNICMAIQNAKRFWEN